MNQTIEKKQGQSELVETKWDLFSLVRIGKVESKNGRICPFLTTAIESLPYSTQETMAVMREFYEAKDGLISKTNQAYINALNNQYRLNTLGYCLNQYYNQHPFPKIGELGAFPAKYIMIHDAHHILLGIETDPQGEIEIIAFEGAMISTQTSQGIIPLLSQIKAFNTFDFDLIRVAKAWEAGANVTGDLLESWDILSYLDWELDDLRIKFNIKQY